MHGTHGIGCREQADDTGSLQSNTPYLYAWHEIFDSYVVPFNITAPSSRSLSQVSVVTGLSKYVQNPV
jgi:hypothetical protein